MKSKHPPSPPMSNLYFFWNNILIRYNILFWQVFYCLSFDITNILIFYFLCHLILLLRSLHSDCHCIVGHLFPLVTFQIALSLMFCSFPKMNLCVHLLPCVYFEVDFNSWIWCCDLFKYSFLYHLFAFWISTRHMMDFHTLSSMSLTFVFHPFHLSLCISMHVPIPFSCPKGSTALVHQVNSYFKKR